MNYWAIILLLFLFSCNQGNNQVNSGELKIDVAIDNVFFRDTAFVSNPVEIQVYKNDSLESKSQLPDTVKQISNALILDAKNHSFGFRQCNADLKKDTLVITFFNLFNSSEEFIIKIFEDNFSVAYNELSDSGLIYSYYSCSQSLILNTKSKKTGTKIRGILNISLSDNLACEGDNKIVLEGPFYFTIN